MKLLITIFCICLLFGPFCISSSTKHNRNKTKINIYKEKASESLKENNASANREKVLHRNITFNSNTKDSQVIDFKFKTSLIHFNKAELNLFNFKNNSIIENQIKENSFHINSIYKRKKNLNFKKQDDSITTTIKNENKTASAAATLAPYYFDYEEDDWDNNAYNLSRYQNFIFKNKCNPNRCAAPEGRCLIGENEKICRCSANYLNFKFANGETLVCGYAQKSQFIAFVLEFSLMFAGNIYLGFYFYAYLKGVVYLSFILFAYFKLPCRLCGLDNMIKDKCYLCPWIEYTTIIIVIFGIFCWQSVDLVKIITTNNKDAFNMPIMDYF